MPAGTKTNRLTVATYLLHKCEVCGGEAPFGLSVKYSRALEAFALGKIDLAKELLGKWYCLKHWREL